MHTSSSQKANTKERLKACRSQIEGVTTADIWDNLSIQRVVTVADFNTDFTANARIAKFKYKESLCLYRKIQSGKYKRLKELKW